MFAQHQVRQFYRHNTVVMLREPVILFEIPDASWYTQADNRRSASSSRS